MSHLEELLYQWHEWRGYIVRRNIKVGKRAAGGWEGELDIVAWHPGKSDLVHLEPSLDAKSWEEREQAFTKRFGCGRKYILTEVFPHLPAETKLRQVAIVVSRGKTRDSVAGGDLQTVDEITRDIKSEIREQGIMAEGAIPEQFDLLRTMQLALCGYYRPL